VETKAINEQYLRQWKRLLIQPGNWDCLPIQAVWRGRYWNDVAFRLTIVARYFKQNTVEQWVLPHSWNAMPFYGNQVRERLQRTLDRHGNFEMISGSKVLPWSE